MLHVPGYFDEAVKPEVSSFLTLSPLDTHHSQSNSDSEDLGGTQDTAFLLSLPCFSYLLLPSDSEQSSLKVTTLSSPSSAIFLVLMVHKVCFQDSLPQNAISIKLKSSSSCPKPTKSGYLKYHIFTE